MIFSDDNDGRQEKLFTDKAKTPEEERNAILELVRNIRPSDLRDTVQGRNAEYGSFVCGVDAAKYAIAEAIFKRAK